MISVIVPIYNVEKYLEQFLNSVINQTFKDVEIIIVNDGSTDNSKVIVDKYMKNSNKIKYFEQNNKGVSEARNLAMTHAKGEYILFLDPDDYLELDMLEKLYKKAIKSNSDVVICGYNEVYDDKVNGKDCSITYNVDNNKLYSGHEVAQMMLNLEVRGYLWHKLFKKDLLEKIDLEFEIGRYIQDYFPVFKAVYFSSVITFVNEPLYNYRQRASSTVYKKNEKMLEDYTHAISNIIGFVEDTNSKLDCNFFIEDSYSNIICGFIGQNYKKGFKMYSYFKNTKYNKYDLSLKYALKIVSYDKSKALKIMLWKLRLIHIAFLIYKM